MATEPGLLADLPDESWRVTETTDLYRDGWVVALRADRILPPHGGGEPFRRLVLEHPGAVVVLALDNDRRVLCLKQFRHPVRHVLVELPAGLRDAGDEPAVETAKRELLEEAELVAEHWTHLLSTWSSPGITDERMEIFLATGLSEASRGDFVLDHEEAEMETFWVPFDDLLAAVLDGRVADGPVAQAVLATRVRGLDGTQETATPE
jgi:8-oxo-dGTP pyrophosphatase MutT (NUDIX family)